MFFCKDVMMLISHATIIKENTYIYIIIIKLKYKESNRQWVPKGWGWVGAGGGGGGGGGAPRDLRSSHRYNTADSTKYYVYSEQLTGTKCYMYMHGRGRENSVKWFTSAKEYEHFRVHWSPHTWVQSTG